MVRLGVPTAASPGPKVPHRRCHLGSRPGKGLLSCSLTRCGEAVPMPTRPGHRPPRGRPTCGRWLHRSQQTGGVGGGRKEQVLASDSCSFVVEWLMSHPLSSSVLFTINKAPGSARPRGAWGAHGREYRGRGVPQTFLPRVQSGRCEERSRTEVKASSSENPPDNEDGERCSE